MRLVVKDLCFEIVDKCPNNCLFCSSNSDLSKSCLIPFEIFKNTLLYILTQGDIEELSFSGGEPMLHPQLHEMIELCSALGIKTTLYTSGIIMKKPVQHSDNPHIQKMIDELGAFDSISQDEFAKLERLGLGKVVFDFQSASVDAYNSLTGTKNNLAYLLKSILHASYFNFEKSIHFIPNKLNINHFQEVLDIAELAGIQELRVLKFVPQGRGRINRHALELNDDELNGFLKEVERLQSKTTKIKIGTPLTQDNRHLCTAGYDKLQIRFDGQVLPCPAFKDIDPALLQQKGFASVNIYRNLADLKIQSGINQTPLCQEFERFD